MRVRTGKLEKRSACLTFLWPLLGGFILLLTTPLSGWAAQPEGEKIFEKRCGGCHDLPDPNKPPPEGWDKRLDLMAPMAGLNKKEKNEVLNFLRSHSQKAEGMLSAAEERKLFMQKCSLCHSEQRVFLEPLTPESRRHIVLRMQERAPDWISPKDAERILAYLDQGAPGGKKPVKKKVNGDAGKIFRERCSACHNLERVYLALEKKESAGSAWMHIVKRMRQKAPEWISPKEAEQIAQYLKSLKPTTSSHKK